MDKKSIFLDNGSTTPVDPRVVEAMVPYFTSIYGNASSRTHSFGIEANKAVKDARNKIARLINGDIKNIIFTSGATEAINLAIKGYAYTNKHRGNHLITTKIEHKAVLDSCKSLEETGFTITYLNVNSDGIVNIDSLKKAITKHTLLVSVMHVNNEIGTIQPLKEVAEICKKEHITFFVDAAQSVGKIPVDVEKLGVDLMSISAHKMYGPKGIGALYINATNKKSIIQPQMVGGGHEMGIRSGTLNVPGIVGFGKAAELSQELLLDDMNKIKKLKETLINGLTSIKNVFINGHEIDRIPGNLNMCFEGVDAESLMLEVNNIALSSGSACTSDSFEPSYVLKALGLSDDDAQSSLRFGIGRFNRHDEIEFTIKEIKNAVIKLRKMASLFSV